MFLSVLLNSLIPVKLQQKFWSFLDKHLTHKKDSTSPSLAMSKSSDKVSSTTKFSTFDILLCIFEGHAESSEEIQQLVITILDTLELFKHSPESDHFENFHSYLDKNAITFQNAEGDTLLHYAATLGYYKLCEWLVLKGKADMNVQNIEGNTPLHLASMFSVLSKSLENLFVFFSVYRNYKRTVQKMKSSMFYLICWKNSYLKYLCTHSQ